MKKLQAPTSKVQRSSKHQAPMKASGCFGTCLLGFAIWSFSGAWKLKLGVFAQACFLFALGLCSSQAQTNTATPGNRYLLIVETSRSMQQRSQGTLRAVQQLLLSGMNGQLRRGDTL